MKKPQNMLTSFVYVSSLLFCNLSSIAENVSDVFISSVFLIHSHQRASNMSVYISFHLFSSMPLSSHMSDITAFVIVSLSIFSLLETGKLSTFVTSLAMTSFSSSIDHASMLNSTLSPFIRQSIRILNFSSYSRQK